MKTLKNKDNKKPLKDNSGLLLSPGCVWKYIDLKEK